MNGLQSQVSEIRAIGAAALAAPMVDVALALPATLLALSAQCAGLRVGAQDVHAASGGAHTGSLSACLIHDAGATFSLIGHSERRTEFRESNEAVKAKAAALASRGLAAVLCVGERAEERLSGNAVDLVVAQLNQSLPDAMDGELAIAYEPVWAIGTGAIPTEAEIGEMHGAIRTVIRERYGMTASNTVGILYGGSVSADNAERILRIGDVDGLLVGRASLSVTDFEPIIKACALASRDRS